MARERLYLFDTTLRDGAQMNGVDFTLHDKLVVAEMLDTLAKLDGSVADPKSENKQQPDYCKNATRSIKPNLLVAIGICTHLGCSPSSKFKKGAEDGMPADWMGGFLCPCHGSTFDFAGRVFKSKPAPSNLEIPPHTYLSETRILIGEDGKGA